MAFTKFKHIERKVTALQLTQATQAKVALVLSAEASNRKLSQFQMNFDEGTSTFSFIFRYLNQSTDSILNQGDYLVKVSDENYVAKTADEFLVDYISTEGDIDPSIVQTPEQSLIAYISEKYPDVTATTTKDLTEDQKVAILEDLKDKYNASDNVLTIDFSNCALTEPSGISDIINAFPKASYTNDDTHFILDFGNKSADKVNSFNYIGLCVLLGDLKRVRAEVLEKLLAISFEGTNAPSAITPSVTDTQWTNFCIEVIKTTGIIRGSQITK